MLLASAYPFILNAYQHLHPEYTYNHLIFTLLELSINMSSKRGRRSGTTRSGKNYQPAEQEVYYDVFCAIYNPLDGAGNYYHWALALNERGTSNWSIFQVVQAVADGPYTVDYREANPMNSRRCLQPLTYLTTIQGGWWGTLANLVNQIQVPGEAASWNCQDYVIDIWGGMYNEGIITQDTYNSGMEAMTPYYGPDFGGEPDVEEEEEAVYDDEEYEEEGQGIQPRSEEFVYDSDDYDEEEDTGGRY